MTRDLLPYEQEQYLKNSKHLSEASIEELEAALIEDEAISPTIPLSELDGQWVLLVGILGPQRRDSEYSSATDGKSFVLCLEVLRELDTELRGVYEKILIWENQQVYARLERPVLREYLARGGEVAVKFDKIKTKTGRDFWNLTLMSRATFSQTNIIQGALR